ncbi:unnamed protein product [Vitrella brassicaformis CCMP3155]|uniref:Uncharacterized protein n=1 Tax=Vitrella brassicaformis (strain CCMP3155) TaxID=1169540 RepID=A0A0G4FMT4_VITBC|nr:unnamed protein product [Vitrella brassicaformis CCMP3155]|eukprot:CEM15082.1 unnamed protein product [Vitrella brassicaformis CCMP3155]
MDGEGSASRIRELGTETGANFFPTRFHNFRAIRIYGKGSFAWAFKGIRDGQEVAFKTWPCPGDIDADGDTAAVRKANDRTRQESFVAAVIEKARLNKLNKAVDREDLGALEGGARRAPFVRLIDALTDKDNSATLHLTLEVAGERKRLVENRLYVAEEVVPTSSTRHAGSAVKGLSLIIHCHRCLLAMGVVCPDNLTKDIFLFWAELKEGRLPPTQPLSSSGLPLSCDGVLALDFSSSLDATHEVPPSAGPSSASAPTTYTASRSAAVPINTAMRVAQRQCPTGTPSALDEALAVLLPLSLRAESHEHQLNRTVVEVFGNGGQSRDARIRIEMTTEEFYPQDLYQG